MNHFIKICGITSKEDALMVEAEGADALGFILHEESDRFVGIEKVVDIVECLHGDIEIFLVFVNKKEEFVANCLNKMGSKINITNKGLIKITGVKKLTNANYKIMSDRIVAGTFVIAAVMLNKNFKVKAGNLKVLNSKVDDLIQEFNFIEINHVYREENKRADQLANMALDK